MPGLLAKGSCLARQACTPLGVEHDGSAPSLNVENAPGKEDARRPFSSYCTTRMTSGGVAGFTR